VIARNTKKLVWQYIEWHNVIKYIDNLKSRIYKAFLLRYTPEIYLQQSIFINSQLVIVLAIKKSMAKNSLVFNSFELGYFIFCLSNKNCLDISFYHYYQEYYSCHKIFVVKYFVRKIKHLIAIWCLEPYYNYLLYLNNLYGIQFYNLNNFNYRRNDKLIHKYYLSFDLSSYILAMSIYVLLNKLYLHKNIKKYLLEFLSLGIFADVIFYLDLYTSSIFLYQDSYSIIYKLLEIFILQLSYEISVLVFSFYSYEYIMSQLTFINYRLNLIMISKDIKKVKRIRKKILDLLLFNGIYVINKLEAQTISLFKGMNINLLSISTNYKTYPFYFIIRPSLYSQFLLMKNLSSILMESVSKPLFILVIRLNMFLFFWSINYINQPIQKIVYLIDYLITLKLRLFIKKKKLNFHIRNLGLAIKKDLCLENNQIYIDRIICIALSNSGYFNYYLVVKIFWLYRLKCNISLREAV